jgi:hypothetical protein
VRFWQFLIGLDAKGFVDFFSALLTQTIAGVTVYIAYQQWRVNKTRLDLDLHDRRLAGYKAVDASYGELATLGTARFSMVLQLRVATAEATFLFPAEVENHLAELYKKEVTCGYVT